MKEKLSRKNQSIENTASRKVTAVAIVNLSRRISNSLELMILIVWISASFCVVITRQNRLLIKTRSTSLGIKYLI